MADVASEVSQVAEVSLVDPRLRFVDADQSLRCSADRYLHAKAAFFEGEREDQSVWVSGSANPSAPDWGPSTVNVEAGVLFSGASARSIAADLGFNGLFELPSISREELIRVVARTSRLHRVRFGD